MIVTAAACHGIPHTQNEWFASGLGRRRYIVVRHALPSWWAPYMSKDTQDRTFPYGNLYVSLYLDIADIFSLCRAEVRKTVQKLRNRILTEGLSFLTKTLPAVGKSFDKDLQHEIYTPLPGLKRRPNSVLPKLFGELLCKIFSDDGRLLDGPNIEAIRHLRTLYFYLYKLEITADDKTNDKVISTFVEVDTSLREVDLPHCHAVCIQAARLTSDIFGLFDPAEIMPRHGPGAVSTGEKCYEKQNFQRIYTRLERLYPFTEYFVLSMTQVVDEYRSYERLEILDSGTAKVVLVPKDSRGPRIISCEPLEYMWIQQGLGNKISCHLERHKLTRGHVNFTSQQINRRLALEGSRTKEWVTLDMKEASDRVSLELVHTMFQLVPGLCMALFATRSTHTRLPDGRLLELQKFAPMGSNLCFPVEAYIFYALAVSAIQYEYKCPRSVARRAVFVFGDDIIVRREYYPAVLQWLPQFGLVFNKDKCCVSGSFRESCGCDAYRGIDVTPLRLKKTWDRRGEADAGNIASYVAQSNAAFKRGYYRVADRCAEMVQDQIGPLPVTSMVTGGLTLIRNEAKHAPQMQPKGVRVRFSRNGKDGTVFNRWEARGYAIRALHQKSDPDNWSTVLRTLTCGSNGGQPGVYALTRRSCLKRVWMALF